MADKQFTKKIPVPENLKGFVIGKNRTGLNEISLATNARVFVKKEENEIYAKGTDQQIKLAEKRIQEKLDKRKTGLCSIDVPVPTEFIGLVKGKRGRNLQRLETKSGAKIRFFSDKGESGVFTISGSHRNCERARALMRESIISFKEHMSRTRLGGDKRFAYFDQDYDRAEFLLKKNNNAPKLDGFIKGQRYRIEIETESSTQKGFGQATITSIKEILLESLRHLHQMKDEEQLKVDLWCHFGRVFVHNVDEEEEESRFTMDNLSRRLSIPTNSHSKTVSSIGGVHEDERSENSRNWEAMFEEGIESSEINDGVLGDGFLDHVLTQWRYDYAFSTPSGRYVRLKVWESLPDNEPPREVKNLLKEVFLEGKGENAVAWLCYPSSTIVRGNIITPCSKYDYRLKLRGGKRFVHNETGSDDEEYEILSDYLSKCVLDSANHCLNLPSSDFPEGFKCSFYRASEEKFYSCEGDKNETFTVIILDEKGWDSDCSDKREQKQFGIRVVLDSWSDALLSGQWEPEEIVSKLPSFMEFLQDFQGMLFD